MNIAKLLRDRAAASPQAPAIIDTRHGQVRTLTFGDLEGAAARAATLLARASLQPGEAVLVFHAMAAELYVALLALFRLGLVAMFLDPSAGREHIEHCLALWRPRALIASSRAHLGRLLSPALRDIPTKFAMGFPIPGATRWEALGRLRPHDSVHPCPADSPALLTFTSGSTGRPKAAVRTHGFLLAQHRALERSLGLAPGEVDLTTLPVFLLANLASGITSLIPDGDLRRPAAIDGAPVVAQIRRHRPSRTVASPAFLESLADYCLHRGLALPELRKIFSGGGPVFPRLLGKLRRLAPQAEIVAVYGSTEVEPIAQIAHHTMHPDDMAAMLSGRGLLAGPPAAGIELRVVPDCGGKPIGPYSRAEFAATCRPPGEAGEIVVSGPHVLRGYLHGDGDEETKFTVDGTVWHRTGDAGYLDDRGRLWLLGRCAARIEDARGRVYPFSVECAVHDHPGIHRAALVALRGRRILAVEPEGHLTSAELTSLGESLNWAPIDEIQVYKHIPVDRRHNAKIDYPALQRLLDGRGRASGPPKPWKAELVGGIRPAGDWA